LERERTPLGCSVDQHCCSYLLPLQMRSFFPFSNWKITPLWKQQTFYWLTSAWWWP
jgi:hypothetical protein